MASSWSGISVLSTGLGPENTHLGGLRGGSSPEARHSTHNHELENSVQELSHHWSGSQTEIRRVYLFDGDTGVCNVFHSNQLNQALQFLIGLGDKGLFLEIRATRSVLGAFIHIKEICFFIKAML